MFAAGVGAPMPGPGQTSLTRAGSSAATSSLHSPADQFTPGETSSLPRRPQFEAPRAGSLFRGDTLRKFARNAVLVTVTAAMIGGAFAPCVHAAEGPAQPQTVATAQVQNEYGLSADTLQAIRQDPELQAQFQSLPREFAHKYGTLTPAQKSMLFKQLSGSTWGVSHRDAFVKGKAFGTDAFQVMTEKLDQAAQKGTLSGAEVSSLKSDIAQLRQLTPAQRNVLAEVILLQQGR